jgi:hypothetical protein
VFRTVSHAAALRSEPRLFLGRYRPIRPLGSGGSGSVWLVWDEQGDREVAVKVVPREGKAGSRARREAQAMSRLEHPRCLRAFACGRDAENVYIAYEYVAGKTFREALRAGELKDADAIEAVAQVLDGLAHAHGRGVVHRDVKPANILLEERAEISVRILDFGLARFADADTLTSAGDVPGTLAYIAPERLRGDLAGPSGDVWSVGVMLYEALAGRHPFWRTTLAETADAIIAGPPPLAQERPDLPAQLLDVVDRALSSDPDRRPSAAKLARLLRRSRGERTSGAAATAALLGRRVAPAFASGVYAAGTTTLLSFYPAHSAAVIAATVPALTYFRRRAGIATALAVPVFPLGNVALALALVYAVCALAWSVAMVAASRPVRRALTAMTLVALVPIVGALAAGPVGDGIPGSRDPLDVALTLAHAAPPALAWQEPAAAAVVLGVPWLVRLLSRFAARPQEVRTYTG